MKVPTSRAPAPKRSTVRWIWAVLQLMRSRGWLRPRRIVAALVLVLVLMFATMWLVGRAIDGIAGALGHPTRPEQVPGGPFPAAAPMGPASSGSATIDRILGHHKLLVAVQESPESSQPLSNCPYTGFDIELLKIIAEKLGTDPALTNCKPLRNFPAGSRQDALEKGQLDLIIGGYEITAAQSRGENVAGPYLERSGIEYGIGLPPRDTVFHDKITAILQRAIDEDIWAQLYRQCFKAPPPRPPVLR